jgi:hypothetical protein
MGPTVPVNSFKDGTAWQGVQEMHEWSEAQEWLKLTNGGKSYKGR